jgi:hypothetical protein
MQKNRQTFIEIFGFPGEIEDNYKPLDKFGRKFVLRQYGLARENRIKSITPETFTIAYAVSTLPGQSGTAVCTRDRIIAIHCGGGKKDEEFNVGRIITPELLSDLERWVKQLDAYPFAMTEQPSESFNEEIKFRTIIEEQQRVIEGLKRENEVNIKKVEAQKGKIEEP